MQPSTAYTAYLILDNLLINDLALLITQKIHLLRKLDFIKEGMQWLEHVYIPIEEESIYMIYSLFRHRKITREPINSIEYFYFGLYHHAARFTCKFSSNYFIQQTSLGYNESFDILQQQYLDQYHIPARKYFLLAINNGCNQAYTGLAKAYEVMGMHSLVHKTYDQGIACGVNECYYNLALWFECGFSPTHAKLYYELAINCPFYQQLATEKLQCLNQRLIIKYKMEIYNKKRAIEILSPKRFKISDLSNYRKNNLMPCYTREIEDIKEEIKYIRQELVVLGEEPFDDFEDNNVSDDSNSTEE
jgi:hypothetical protein